MKGEANRFVETGEYLEIVEGDGLSKADAPSPDEYADPLRPSVAKLERRLARAVEAMLSRLGASIAKQLRESGVKTGTVEKADLPDDIEALISQLDLAILLSSTDDFEEVLEEVFADSGRLALSHLGQTGTDQIVEVVNERAVNWAKEHAADLLGVSDDPEFSIDRTTRDMVRASIAKGLADNKSMPQIADDLEDSYAFSAKRARVIAAAEVTSANSMGALASYEEAEELGIKTKKGWLVLEDGCPICQGNADAGYIDLDKPFPSGDMAPGAHPGCRCVVVPKVIDENDPDDDVAEKADQPRHPAGSAKGGQFMSTGAGGSHTMTEEQAEALEDYMVSSFVRINEGSRNGMMSPEDAKAASVLDNMATDTLNESTVLYRRSVHPISELKDARGRSVNANTTGRLTQAGFTSTSFSRDVVEDFGMDALGARGKGDADILWEIKAPKGTRGIDVSAKLKATGLEDIMGGQEEFILPRNTGLSVLQVRKLGPKSYVISAQVQYQPPVG